MCCHSCRRVAWVISDPVCMAHVSTVDHFAASVTSRSMCYIEATMGLLFAGGPRSPSQLIGRALQQSLTYFN